MLHAETASITHVEHHPLVVVIVYVCELADVGNALDSLESLRTCEDVRVTKKSLASLRCKPTPVKAEPAPQAQRPQSHLSLPDELRFPRLGIFPVLQGEL